MKLKDDPMYAVAERIMAAAGSSLRHYMPQTKQAIVDTVRREFSRSYIAGSNGLMDAFEAAREGK